MSRISRNVQSFGHGGGNDAMASAFKNAEANKAATSTATEEKKEKAGGKPTFSLGIDAEALRASVDKLAASAGEQIEKSISHQETFEAMLDEVASSTIAVLGLLDEARVKVNELLDQKGITNPSKRAIARQGLVEKYVEPLSSSLDKLKGGKFEVSFPLKKEQEEALKGLPRSISVIWEARELLSQKAEPTFEKLSEVLENGTQLGVLHRDNNAEKSYFSVGKNTKFVWAYADQALVTTRMARHLDRGLIATLIAVSTRAREAAEKVAETTLQEFLKGATQNGTQRLLDGKEGTYILFVPKDGVHPDGKIRVKSDGTTVRVESSRGPDRRPDIGIGKMGFLKGLEVPLNALETDDVTLDGPAGVAHGILRRSIRAELARIAKQQAEEDAFAANLKVAKAKAKEVAAAEDSAIISAEEFHRGQDGACVLTRRAPWGYGGKKDGANQVPYLVIVAVRKAEDDKGPRVMIYWAAAASMPVFAASPECLLGVYFPETDPGRPDVLFALVPQPARAIFRKLHSEWKEWEAGNEDPVTADGAVSSEVKEVKTTKTKVAKTKKKATKKTAA